MRVLLVSEDILNVFVVIVMGTREITILSLSQQHPNIHHLVTMPTGPIVNYLNLISIITLYRLSYMDVNLARIQPVIVIVTVVMSLNERGYYYLILMLLVVKGVKP